MSERLTVEEAAKKIGRTTRYFRQLIREGKVSPPPEKEDPSVRSSRLWVHPDFEVRRSFTWLTDEEKKLIAELARAEKYPQQIAREINLARTRRGEKNKVSDDAIYKFIRKQREAAAQQTPRRVEEEGTSFRAFLESRAQKRRQIRLVRDLSTPETIEGTIRISDLKALGYSEKEIRKLFGLLDETTIGGYALRISDLRGRGYSEEEIRKLFGAFEDARAELQHERHSENEAPLEPLILHGCGYTPEAIDRRAAQRQGAWRVHEAIELLGPLKKPFDDLRDVLSSEEVGLTSGERNAYCSWFKEQFFHLWRAGPWQGSAELGRTGHDTGRYTEVAVDLLAHPIKHPPWPTRRDATPAEIEAQRTKLGMELIARYEDGSIEHVFRSYEQ